MTRGRRMCYQEVLRTPFTVREVSLPMLQLRHNEVLGYKQLGSFLLSCHTFVNADVSTQRRSLHFMLHKKAQKSLNYFITCIIT
jgi:hypothetical protein